ncbi:MAG: peptidoglycan DD-metalloendopeptidase family protein [Succinivibrio sp.]|nr:peptidoglycan DD-metalloendopeptidase family protein [Succinivibrio sp.]
MKSEDYIALDVVETNHNARAFSKKQISLISATLFGALSLSLLAPSQLSLTGSSDDEDAYLANQPESFHETYVDPAIPLVGGQTVNTTTALVSTAAPSEQRKESMTESVAPEVTAQVASNKPMDNYDDILPESELADSDEVIDAQYKNLTAVSEPAKKQEVVSKWFVEDVQKGDTISSIFADLNIPASVTMAILDHKNVAKEVNSLSLGQHLSFLIDEKNVLQQFVKPLPHNKQLRFYRSEKDPRKFDYAIESAGRHMNAGDEVTTTVSSEAEQTLAAQVAQTSTDAKADTAEKKAPAPQVTAAADTKKAAPVKKVNPIENRGRLVLVKINKGDSFSTAANNSGVSYGEVNQILRMFKGRVQFARNIHPGDEMRVLFSDAHGKGKITAVELKLGKKKFATYLNPADGKYYDEKGMNSNKSAFRRFPLNGKIRVTSPFNPGRRHPVLGYVRPHNGTDFGVPVGTPVICPADGVVDKAGYSRGAGYYMVVRHRGGISTVYMHLSKIVAKEGQHVKLGKTIARTGNTGISTGPHLHYELRINGRPVNAMRVNLGNAVDSQVNKKERQRFASNVAKYKKELYSKNLMAKL